MINILTETHKIYKELNKKMFDNKLPQDIILTFNNKGKCTNKEFWILNDNKMYEISISPKSFMKGEDEYLFEFARLMVSLHCKINGIKDIVKGSFTEEYDLECVKFGLELLEPNEKVKDIFENLSFDREIFKLKPINKPIERKSADRKPMFKYICPKCEKEIKSTIEDLKVLCKECNEEFIGE